MVDFKKLLQRSPEEREEELRRSAARFEAELQATITERTRIVEALSTQPGLTDWEQKFLSSMQYLATTYSMGGTFGGELADLSKGRMESLEKLLTKHPHVRKAPAEPSGTATEPSGAQSPAPAPVAPAVDVTKPLVDSDGSEHALVAHSDYEVVTQIDGVFVIWEITTGACLRKDAGDVSLGNSSKAVLGAPPAPSVTDGFHPDGSIPLAGEIFVFGSNLAGRHGAGSAWVAKEQFGAIYGQGHGPQGNAYAIPTKDGRPGTPPLRDVRATLPLAEIQESIDTFIQYAKAHPEQRFFVVRLGCALAAHEDIDIAPLFRQAPDNCSFPEEWAPYLAGRGMTELQRRVTEARDAFFNGKTPYRLPQSVSMGDGYVVVKVMGDRLRLSQIFVPPEKRELKLGQAYLQELLTVADKHGVELECSVEPYGGTEIGPGTEVLKEWYQRNGFIEDTLRENTLIRPPLDRFADEVRLSARESRRVRP